MNEIDEFLKVKREFHRLESEISGGMSSGVRPDETHVSTRVFNELLDGREVHRLLFNSDEYLYEFYFVHDGCRFFTLSNNKDFMPCE